MKKTLLLSVVASTMIMAGGDIAPVEPVVEAPVAASAWEFSGQGVVYYQTIDSDLMGGGSLFDQDNSQADAGIQLKAVNSDVIGGIGMGFAVNGLSTLNLENYMVSGVMQATGNPHTDDVDGMTDGGWISEAYVTYGFGNTSIKAGRQTLPKALSPFAFSEDWNVFQNTYDAVLLVNTDISNTTLVGAWVAGNNVNSMMLSDLTDFNSLNNDDGLYMLTVQNKSITDLTLTGSWYYGNDFADGQNDINILWADAQYNAASFNLGLQGGQVSHDAFDDDITSFGAKIGTTFGGINAEVAFSTVNDGGLPLSQEGGHVPMGFGAFNLGGTTSALYTTTMADELVGSSIMNVDADKWVVRANMDALGGNFSALYAMTSGNDDIIGDTDEFDIAYTTKVADSLDLSAAYMYADNDLIDTSDVVRVIANYKF
jgi:hypothetical protein